MDNLNNNVETVDTIDLQELLLILWKNVLFIGIVTILVAATAALFTKYFLDEEYAADTKLQISTKDGGTYSDLQLSKALVKNYVYFATSRDVLNHVINDESLNLNMTYKQLYDIVKVSQVSDTDILIIEVTTDDPNLSANIANKVSDSLFNFIKDDKNILEVKQFDKAIASKDPVGPNLMLNTVIGLVLGGMLSVGIVLLKEFLNRTLRSSKDVEKYLNLPVLGAIPMLDKKYVD